MLVVSKIRNDTVGYFLYASFLIAVRLEYPVWPTNEGCVEVGVFLVLV